MRRTAALLSLAALFACSEEEAPQPDPQAQAEVAAREQRLHAVCSAPETYARLREALFDEAARRRAGEAAALDEAAGAAAVSVLEPVTATGDPRGVVVCSGRLLLELPTEGEPRRMAADVEYAAQAASDGSGLVFELEGAGALAAQLAGFNGPASPAPSAPPAASDAEIDGAHRARHSEGPSFECAQVRVVAERVICTSRLLSRLDREMASLYYDQMASADERKRQLLRRTRDAFLKRRDRCQEAGCIASVYEDRIAEIRRIGARG
jgi:hypothetical protein